MISGLKGGPAQPQTFQAIGDVGRTIHERQDVTAASATMRPINNNVAWTTGPSRPPTSIAINQRPSTEIARYSSGATRRLSGGSGGPGEFAYPVWSESLQRPITIPLPVGTGLSNGSGGQGDFAYPIWSESLQGPLTIPIPTQELVMNSSQGQPATWAGEYMMNSPQSHQPTTWPSIDASMLPITDAEAIPTVNMNVQTLRQFEPQAQQVPMTEYGAQSLGEYGTVPSWTGPQTTSITPLA